MYRNPEGRILSGNTKIIYIELTKLGEIEKKPVSEMTGMEKWALFLKYFTNKKKQSLIQEIISSEEGIRMGAEVLETISKDREEFSRYFHYLKAEIDRESQRIYAHRKGVDEGIVIGKEEGIVIGKEEGIVIGKEVGIDATLQVITALMAHTPIDEIAVKYHMSIEQVERIQSTIRL